MDPVIRDLNEELRRREQQQRQYDRTARYCEQLIRDLSGDDLAEAITESDATVQDELLKAFHAGDKERTLTWLQNIVDAWAWGRSERLAENLAFMDEQT